jgi:XTP/dITP diphosphohydrolase
MKLYLASGNAHKVQEFQSLADASALPIEMVSARAIGGMPPVAEDTGTFVGNARKKALALKEKLPLDTWVMADDSGLCVDALAGAPGVESAYYAGPQGDSAANLAKLIDVMRDVPSGKRSARFVCVLYLVGPEGREHREEAFCSGFLITASAGLNGFGYDPIFLPDGFSKTMAELDTASKNKISHRGRAWARIVPFLKTLK